VCSINFSIKLRLSLFAPHIAAIFFDECKPAIELGKKENITVAEFCEESLNRLYGEEWYSQFKELIGK